MHKITDKSPYEKDKIKENTTSDGNIVCIDCNLGSLKEKNKKLTVSDGPFGPKLDIKTKLLCCNNCDYYYLNEAHTKEIRKKLKKAK